MSEQPDRLPEIQWRRERKRDGWYPEDIDYLVGEIKRLQDRLREIEWEGPSPEGMIRSFCPACGQSYLNGHASDCWLAAELAKENHNGPIGTT